MVSEGTGGCAHLVHSLLNRAVGAPPEALKQVCLLAHGIFIVHNFATRPKLDVAVAKYLCTTCCTGQLAHPKKPSGRFGNIFPS